MAELRFSALKEVFGRVPVETTPPANNISKFYGVDVFNLHKMEHYLSTEAFRVIRRAINEGKSLTLKEADQVAIGLKAWALERALPIILTGFILLPTEQQRSMTGSLTLATMVILWKISQERCWFSRNPTPQAFQAEE